MSDSMCEGHIYPVRGVRWIYRGAVFGCLWEKNRRIYLSANWVMVELESGPKDAAVDVGRHVTTWKNCRFGRSWSMETECHFKMGELNRAKERTTPSPQFFLLCALRVGGWGNQGIVQDLCGVGCSNKPSRLLRKYH